MYSIKPESNSGKRRKTSNNIHYRIIRHFSVNLAVVTLVTTLMLMPPFTIFSQAIELGLQNGLAIRDKEVTTSLLFKRPQDQTGMIYATRFHLR
jgi:hypothetical protein